MTVSAAPRRLRALFTSAPLRARAPSKRSAQAITWSTESMVLPVPVFRFSVYFNLSVSAPLAALFRRRGFHRRFYGGRLEAHFFPHFGHDGSSGFGMVLEKLLGRFTPLADALAGKGIPGAALFDHA